MSEDRKNDELPPRPNEKPVNKKTKTEKKIVLYINGNPVEMSYTEGLGVLAQLSQILLYFDNLEREEKENEDKH
jgi:hypothetical protein